MSIEEQTTHRVEPIGYTLTRPPRDPYVGFGVSALLFVVMFFGGLPEGVTAEDVASAVEGIAGGGMVLFGIASEVWRRRIHRGNVLK